MKAGFLESNEFHVEKKKRGVRGKKIENMTEDKRKINVKLKRTVNNYRYWEIERQGGGETGI